MKKKNLLGWRIWGWYFPELYKAGKSGKAPLYWERFVGEAGWVQTDRQPAVSSCAVWTRGLHLDASFIRGISLKWLRINCVPVPRGLWSVKFIWIYNDSVSTSQWTHRVCIRQYSRLMLNREIITAYCRNYSAFIRNGHKNAEFLMLIQPRLTAVEVDTT